MFPYTELAENIPTSEVVYITSNTVISRRIARKNGPLASHLSRSLMVHGTDTDRSATYCFLSVVTTGLSPTIFKNKKRRFLSKIADFSYLVYLLPMLTGFLLGILQWCSQRDQGLGLAAPRGQKWKSWSWSWIMKSWFWSWTFNLGLGLGLEEKILQFFKTFVVIFDSNEQGTPWHLVRQQKQFAIWKPLFERTYCTPCTSASVERVFNNGAIC